MLKKIKFTASGASASIGAFSPGDIASVSEEVARHLVEDMQAATYDLQAQAPAPAEGQPAVMEQRFTTTQSMPKRVTVRREPAVDPSPAVEK